ncbi:MAG TPA: AI-2E family transporter [Bryobacteraceae bacterium]|nr:AI-2E family transporter [Bryobacteraceae bacterium]
MLESVWTLFLFALVVFIVYQIRWVVLLFALAVILAHLLAPLVAFVQRLIPRNVPRVIALVVVYVVLIGAVIAAMIPLGSRLSAEAASLANRLPGVLQSDPLSRLPVPQRFESMRPEVTQFVEDRLHELGARIGPMLTQAGTRIISGFGVAVGFVLVPILAFFFLKDGAEIRDGFIESFPAARHSLLTRILDDLHDLLAHYIRSLVLLSLSSFIFYSIFLSATGAPYPVLFSGFAAALEFIPAVGPFVAGVTIILGTAFAGYTHVLALVIFLIVYRIFQDYVLSPHLMSAGLNIHPMLVLFGVLAGDQLAGIPGMFFSVPVMAALRLILIRLRKRRSATHPHNPH